MLEDGRVVAGSGRLEGSGKWTETQKKKWGEASAVQTILFIINSDSVRQFSA